MPEFYGWDVCFEYSVHKMLGFYGWDGEFSQSIHKLGLFHGWNVQGLMDGMQKMMLPSTKTGLFVDGTASGKNLHATD